MEELKEEVVSLYKKLRAHATLLPLVDYFILIAGFSKFAHGFLASAYDKFKWAAEEMRDKWVGGRGNKRRKYN